MGRFERIANHRIYQQIVDQISRMVKEGSLRPGDRLPAERQLAEEFGVSRAAVREALSALTLMGMLEVRPGEGTFIRSVTEEGLVTPLAMLLTLERDEALGLELLEVRGALEAEGAFLAAHRRDADDIFAMETAMAEMRRALDSEELAADADWRFHNAIGQASGNGLLIGVMRTLKEHLRDSIKVYRARLLRFPTMQQTLVEEHQRILDAIRDKRPEDAHSAMRAHIDRVKWTLYLNTTVAKPPAEAEPFR